MITNYGKCAPHCTHLHAGCVFYYCFVPYSFVFEGELYSCSETFIACEDCATHVPQWVKDQVQKQHEKEGY